MKIKLSGHNDIAIVTLDNGATNAITRDLINLFIETLSDAEKRFNGIVIRGNEKFFSMGFYLPELLSLSQEEFKEFYDSFNELILKIFSISVPTCSILEGHAVAGGFILALATDFRIALPGKKIGLNEINLGVPVPFLAKELLKRLTKERIATKLLYSGDFITTDEGFNFDLIDALENNDTILTKSINLIDNYKNKPKKVFDVIKKSMVSSVISNFEKFRDIDRRHFLDCWYTEEAQKILKETAKKF